MLQVAEMASVSAINARLTGLLIWQSLCVLRVEEKKQWNIN
jgi:hypothetical protein